MDLISTVLNQLDNEDTLRSIGNRANAQPSEVQNVTKKGLPMIMEGLNQRTSKDEQASAQLASSVDKHEGDDVSNLANLFQTTDQNEGGNLLDLAFGNRQHDVENQLAQETSVEKPKIRTILKLIAPIALSMLAKRKGSGSLGSGGLSSLLGSFSQDMQSQSGFNVQGMLSGFLGGDDASDENDGPLDKLGDLFKRN